MRREYYALTLDDYSIPSIASGSKQYFGTLDEIADFINSLKDNKEQAETHKGLLEAFDKFCAGDKQVTHYVAYNQHQLLKPVQLIATFEHEMQNYEWEHTNAFGFPYYMRFKSAKVKHYWFKSGKRYLRCIKADMVDLQYKNTFGAWVCRSGDYWGFPNIVIYKPPHIYNQLAVQEKLFDSVDELKIDEEKFEPGKDIDFTELCNDIFGDG